MAGKRIIALYPLVPWIGVMAAGYCFGTLLTGEQVHRRRRLIQLGLALCGLFILVRAANVYGDPRPWAHQKSALFTALSFLNCTKYPPSLQYLLMTIGPGILFLGLADRPLPSWTSVFIVFGRVPLFYYVLHVPLIRMSAVLANKILHPAAAQPAGPMGAGQGFGLGGVYLAWILIVIVLYFPCRWFADVKRRRRDPWLSYL